MAQLLSTKAVCDKIALSRTTLFRLVQTGEFPEPIQLTKRRKVYDAAAVDRWIAEKLGEAA
jgi:prophage regulatory protein